MKKALIPFVVWFIAGIACTSNTTSTSTRAAKQATANVVNQLEQVVGTWQGIIPCADCPGINYTLQLLPDQTYQEELVYLERSQTPLELNGTWEVNASGILTLQKPGRAGMTKFEITPDGLIMLDMDGKRIKSGVADMYRLNRINEKETLKGNPQVWQEKFNRGLDFVAMGNEPSWSLELDSEKMLSFTAMDAAQTSITTPVPNPTVLQSPDGVMYVASTGAGDLRVEMRKVSCTDNMAGNRFSYTVTVTAKGKRFDGCGMYLYDRNLSGNWILQELNGKAIDTDTQPKGVPMLMLDPEQGKVHGTGGCNRINGAIDLKGHSITFNQMAVTRMACPNMQVENEFLGLLSGKTLQYQVQSGLLRLKVDGVTVMTFKQVA